MRIVFMGTPDFAVPCLARLIADGHEIAGVFTQPDKPKGRGYKLAPPPVKELALANGLPVWQPEKLRDGTALAVLRELAPQLIAVVAYGRMLPKEILDLPEYGCINVHGSLLPKYRGAAPIQWSVLNGDLTAGVTTMYMAEGMDTGDMILSRSVPVGEDETSGELFDRLAVLGAEALSETVRLIAGGNAPRTPQDDAQASRASMLTKEMAVIDWSKSAREVHNLIRGMNPQVAAVDEITRPEDAQAVVEAAGCGVALIATAHGAGVEDLNRRPAYREFLAAGVFRRLVVLARRGAAWSARIEVLS